MKWTVLFHAAFEPEFWELHGAVQDEILAHARLLEAFGPELGRPRVDTLKGSRHANMKELRFRTARGGSRSPSTRNGEPSCWWPETSRGVPEGDFTGG